MSDTITDTKVIHSSFSFTVEVGKYGITAYPPTRNGEPAEIECNGSASIVLDKEEAVKLSKALTAYLRDV